MSNTHPGPCLKCSLPWRHYGPGGLRECDNEHVYRLVDAFLYEVKFPEFTAQQIRDAEVALYRERKVNTIPNRRAALLLLREEFDHNVREDTEGVNP